jgi:hypothetical protein
MLDKVKVLTQIDKELCTLKNEKSNILKDFKFIIESEFSSVSETNKTGLSDKTKCYCTHDRDFFSDQHIMTVYSDSLFYGLLLTFDMNYFIDSVNGELLNSEFIEFLFKHAKELINHPDSEKLIKLYDSMDVNNLELIKQLLDGTESS